MARMSDRFYKEIRKSHKVVSYVDVISPDNETVRLHALDGSVDCDKTAAIRRKIGVHCIDPTGVLTPRANGELLTPFGTEIRAYRGVEYADGEQEVASLGVFRLSRCTVADSNSGSPVITLEGFDRSRTIQRAKFTSPYVISPGTNAISAIKAIVQRTFPEVEFDSISSPVSTTAPLLYDAGSDPLEAIFSLAASVGCHAYFDAEGRFAILPPHDVNALPSADFTIIEGEGSTMLDLAREYTDEPGYNGFIVTGESVGDNLPPVRGEAWDDNPTSPTYRRGPYGEVPGFYTDNLAKTADQCTTVARALLAEALGFSSKLAVTTWVNPSYEADDIVEVKRLKSGVDGVYSVDAFSVPFRAGETQGLTLRERYPR
jgi:hypothetical protein